MGRRIHETLQLRFTDKHVFGSGVDADGEFELAGMHDGVAVLALIRSYTYCTAGPSGIGIPYEYVGRWDGGVVAGHWEAPDGLDDGGPFEMWPLEADDEAYSLEGLRERELVPA